MMVKKFLGLLVSYVIALFRLAFWMIILFFSGIQQILFTKSEICGIEVKIIPLWYEREERFNKLSYIDKLVMENPDLAVIDDNDVSDYIDDILDKEEDDEDNGDEK